ncbi:hypothetical protein DDI_4122 [Dickeya dianthicola RNS04.9]|nr:hypothetical protein DDI_4122 [Dickeya dianthicola RNS04.9]
MFFNLFNHNRVFGNTGNGAIGKVTTARFIACINEICYALFGISVMILLYLHDGQTKTPLQYGTDAAFFVSSAL